MCEWFYSVVDYFDVDRETVAIAFNYIDRTFTALIREKQEESSSSSCHKARIPKRKLHLITLTCLQIAMKLHGETYDKKKAKAECGEEINVFTFVELSRGSFDAKAIEAMELKVLRILGWRVNPPTCSQFIGSLLSLCQFNDSKASDAILDVARYLAELSICVSDFAYTCTDSVVAFACIECAIEFLSAKNFIKLTEDDCSASLCIMAKAIRSRFRMEEIFRTRAMVRDLLCPTMFGQERKLLPSLDVPRISIDPAAPYQMQCGGQASPISVRDGLSMGNGREIPCYFS